MSHGSWCGHAHDEINAVIEGDCAAGGVKPAGLLPASGPRRDRMRTLFRAAGPGNGTDSP